MHSGDQRTSPRDVAVGGGLCLPALGGGQLHSPIPSLERCPKRVSSPESGLVFHESAVRSKHFPRLHPTAAEFSRAGVICAAPQELCSSRQPWDELIIPAHTRSAPTPGMACDRDVLIAPFPSPAAVWGIRCLPGTAGGLQAPPSHSQTSAGPSQPPPR